MLDPFLGGDSKLLMMQEKPKFSESVLRKVGVCFQNTCDELLPTLLVIQDNAKCFQ